MSTLDTRPNDLFPPVAEDELALLKKAHSNGGWLWVRDGDRDLVNRVVKKRYAFLSEPGELRLTPEGHAVATGRAVPTPDPLSEIRVSIQPVGGRVSERWPLLASIDNFDIREAVDLPKGVWLCDVGGHAAVFVPDSNIPRLIEELTRRSMHYPAAEDQP